MCVAVLVSEVAFESGLAFGCESGLRVCVCVCVCCFECVCVLVVSRGCVVLVSEGVCV